MDTMIKYAFYAYLINEELEMRNEELRCQLSLTDFKTPPPLNGDPPPLSGEAINRDFLKFARVLIKAPLKGELASRRLD